MTTSDLEALTFGYLTGADLVQFCAPQLLISRWNVNNSNLQRGCMFAYNEVIRNLSNRYDATDEFKSSRLVSNVATATVVSGAITGFTSITPGIYQSTPDIIITDTGGGNGAEAVAVLTGTGISDITLLTGGKNYITPVVSADQRENVLVQIAAILAVKKILSNMEKWSDEMKDHFAWAEANMLDIRNGQMNLQLPEASKVELSCAHLVCGKFRTIG